MDRTPHSLDEMIEQFRSLREDLKQERETAVVISILIEEYKTRWQQLVQMDSEVDKWSASYAIALVIGVSWILSSQGITDLEQLFLQRKGDNSYFILSLAIVNVAYILNLTFKGYQINQLRIYIYEKICRPLNALARSQANSWESWHRKNGRPEWRRLLYYPVVTVLPFAVSISLLMTFYHYVGRSRGWFDPHNIYFYFVVLLQLVAGGLSISTMGLNGRWRKTIMSPDPGPRADRPSVIEPDRWRPNHQVEENKRAVVRPGQRSKSDNVTRTALVITSIGILLSFLLVSLSEKNIPKKGQ